MMNMVLEPIKANGAFSKLSTFLLGVGAIGLIITAVMGLKDWHHVSYSYLTAFIFVATISLGSLFFVLIQHLTRAGWSVLVRRIPELLMTNIWVVAVLFIPVLFGLHELFHWTHQDALAYDPILQGKSPYLNIPFFIVPLKCKFPKPSNQDPTKIKFH